MNQIDDPYVFLFCTAKNHYFYDVNTNLICRITQESSYILNQHGAFNQELQGYKDAGLLLSNTLTRIQHPLTRQIGTILHTRVNRIILQLTQQCNLRCHYCVYSEKYSGTRNHSLAQMTKQTLRKSLEFLSENSSEVEELHIGFYGGEPLLRFDLINEAFIYSDVLFAKKMIHYSITTNGLLLSEKIVESMVSHNVTIHVSIDGPEIIHDKNRRDYNGKGSFSRVINNLEYIYVHYPEFYHKNITFNAVLDGSTTYDDILPFFTTHHLFKNNYVKCSGLNLAIPNSLYSYPENRDKRRLSFRKNAVLYYYKTLTDSSFIPPHTLEKPFSFWMMEEGLKKRPEPTSLGCIHSGLCIPGISRLFINTEGEFYICEKVPELFDGPGCIGKLESGFDVQKITELLNLQNTSKSGCSSCWAIHLCRICAAMVDMQDYNWDESLHKLCESTREALAKQLVEYCTYFELKNHMDSNQT